MATHYQHLGLGYLGQPPSNEENSDVCVCV
jgi:hypothetical protein